MIIRDIKLKSKNNPNIFVITTDSGEFIFHSDIIVKYSLSGSDIQSDLFFKALRESEILIATNLAMKYLSTRVKTEKQTREYLLKKNFTLDAIDEVIMKMKEYKVIDDSEYAKAYIRSNMQTSKMRLKQKLIKSGVSKDNIDESLTDIDDYNSCFVNAKKFLKNKEINKENCEKLTRKLYYLGYAWDTIKKVLWNLANLDLEES